MTPREQRLRQRIDQLLDDREGLQTENQRLRATIHVFVARATATGNHINQHGYCPPRYQTQEERDEARRLTWRLSKRRAYARRKTPSDEPVKLTTSAGGPAPREVVSPRNGPPGRLIPPVELRSADNRQPRRNQ